MKVQRIEARHELHLPLMIQSKEGDVVARSQNLSTRGACIALVDGVNAESLDNQGSLVIRTGQGSIKANYEITYRKENVIGVKFQNPSADHIDAMEQMFSMAQHSTASNLEVSESSAKRGFLGGLSRKLWLAGRMALITYINLGWPLVRASHKTDVVFACYGTRGDMRAYGPDWFRKFFPVGVAAFLKDKSSEGFMVSSVYSEEELASDSDKVRAYISELQRKMPNAKRIALIGRLPGFCLRAGIEIKPPLVDGAYGTRFAMYGSAMSLLDKLENKQMGTSIAILGGAGRIGSQVIEDLSYVFKDVIAIDPRYTEEKTATINGSRVLYTKHGKRLKETRLVLVLTARGNDILPMVNQFAPGTLIADDTHPCVKRPVREKLAAQGVELWKTVITSDSFTMTPRMPNFHANNIPGCLLEALVLNTVGDQALDTPQVFFDETEKCGYRAELIRHPNDS